MEGVDAQQQQVERDFEDWQKGRAERAERAEREKPEEGTEADDANKAKKVSTRAPQHPHPRQKFLPPASPERPTIPTQAPCTDWVSRIPHALYFTHAAGNSSI